MLTFIFALFAALKGLLHHDPHDVQMAISWGPIIAAAVNVVGGLLKKKGQNQANKNANAALASANEARGQALGQLSNENINAILNQYFPGLVASGSGGPQAGSARGATGTPSTGPRPQMSAWTEAFQAALAPGGAGSTARGASGARAGGTSPGGAAGLLDQAPNTDRYGFAEGQTPTYTESHPGQGQEADQHLRQAADILMKYGLDIPTHMAGAYAMPGGAGVAQGHGAMASGGDVSEAGSRGGWGGDLNSNPMAAQGAYTTQPVGQHGGAGGGSCFAAGTLVLTPDGPVPIESLHEGDTVMGGEGLPVLVTERRVLSAGMFYILNGTLKVTGEHPFAVRPKFGHAKWVQAQDLKERDELIGLEMPGAIKSIGTMVVPEEVVYNPAVEAPNTYFVLLNGCPVLVHNKTKANETMSTKPSLGYALGGDPPPGVPVTVGEQGPETVMLPKGGTVVPNPATTAQLPGNRTPTAAAPGQIDTGVAPKVAGAKAATAPGMGAGALVSKNITDFLANPGQTSPAAYERDVANSNQALNASRMAVSGELTGAGVDPSSGAGQFELSNAIGQAHRSRNEASQNQAMREESLRRDDLDRGIKDYMAALQQSFNLAQARSAAIAGVAFPNVQPIDTYSSLASGVSSLGYFLGQALNNKSTTTSTSSSAGAE